jgi:hypothetical protein
MMMKIPNPTWRIYATAASVVLWILCVKIYGIIQGPIEGAAAAQQLDDSNTTYVVSRAVTLGLVPQLLTWGLFAFLAVIWATYAREMSKAKAKSAVLLLLLLSACTGPAKVEQFEEIGPNETAYVIPLEGASNAGQAKFDSIAFLDAKKVAAKRVSMPLRERSLGRPYWDYEWIRTARVIKVDRAPVTREWTSSAATGTSANDQAMHMQSLDSIPFHIGATITVSIVEDDASKFLYNFGGRPLHNVVDMNIRSFILGELSSKFAGVSLADGMKDKSQYFKEAGNDAVVYFKGKGITVDYFGIEGGLGYDNPAVQQSLDRKFIAENDKQVAENEQKAQVVRNQTIIAKATADAEAAQKFAAAKDALTVKTEMEATILRAQATKIAAERWDGHLGNVVPAGSSLLFGLDNAGHK